MNDRPVPCGYCGSIAWMIIPRYDRGVMIYCLGCGYEDWII